MFEILEDPGAVAALAETSERRGGGVRTRPIRRRWDARPQGATPRLLRPYEVAARRELFTARKELLRVKAAEGREARFVPELEVRLEPSPRLPEEGEGAETEAVHDKRNEQPPQEETRV